MKNLSYKSLFIVFFFLLISVVVLAKFILPKNIVKAAWWNDGWNYRKAISISNTSGSNLTDFQVSISIGTSALISAGKMQSDCDDIRITDINGNLLPYWIEENNPGCNQIADTKIWVKTSSLSTSGSTVYLYYGNQSATAIQDGNKVFDFFDDFNDGVINNSKWQTYSGTMAETSSSPGYIYENSSTLLNYLVSKDYIFTNGVIEYRTSGTRTAASGDPDNDNAMIWRYQDVNNFYFVHYDFANPAGSTVCDPACDVVDVRKKQNGAYASGVWIDSPTLTEENNWYNFKISANGSNFNVYYSKIGTTTLWTDTTWASGKVGLGSFHNEESARFDYIFVHKYASVDPTVGFQSEEAGGGPIAYWKFDEGVGTTAYDSSSNQNNGAISGGIWKTEDQCISGKCLQFNGSSTNIVAGNNPSLRITNAMTLESWVKFNYLDYSNNTGKLLGFGSKGYPDSATPNSGWWFSYDNRNNNSSFSYTCFGNSNGGWNGGNNNFSGYNYVFSIDTWYHIAVTVTSTEARLYINGKQLGAPKAISNLQLSDINRNLKLGSLDSSALHQGYLDDFKIYPYARTPAQIKLDYNSRGSTKGTTANLGSNAHNSEALSEGLVGYWKMDEGTGNSITDSSGNNITGTTVPAWSSGKYGIGISLNGTTDKIKMSNNNPIGTAENGFTLSAWIYQNGNQSGKQVLFLDQIQLRPGFFFTNNGSFQQLSFTPPATNSWHHIVGTFDGQYMKAYVDGVFLNQLSVSGNINNATDFRIGGRYDDAEDFNGLIDEVRVYNRALSPTEVTQLYEYAPGPVAEWNFEENTGLTTKDTSGNNYDGTFGTGNSAPTWNQGKIGSGLNFDGINNFVNFNDTTVSNKLLNLYSATYSFWIYPKALQSSGSSSQTLIEKRDCTISTILNTTGTINTILWYSSNSDSWTSNKKLGYYNSGIDQWTTADLNKWYYVTIIYDSATNKSRTYINGILDREVILANSANRPIGTINTSTSTQLGRYRWSTTNFFQGKMDQVKIYNYARTQKQIIEDMSATGRSASGRNAIAYYKFDEGSGTTANNSGNGGTSLNGTISGATWATNGKFNKALNFNGTSNYISNPNISINSNQLTVSAWINPNNLSSAGDISNQGQWDGGPWTGWRLRQYNNTIFFKLGNNTTTNYELQVGTLVANTWQHVVGVWDGDYIYIYINGKEAGKSAKSFTYVNNGDIHNIGKYPGSAYFFNGLIDEVKIYNYALTSDEIKQDYNQNSSIQMGSTTQTIGATTTSLDYCIPGDTSFCASPIAEWKMDEKVGTSVVDTSGNNNTGTISGATWTQGKIGSGLNFDGVNDYIDAGTRPSLTPNNITIEGWVKAKSFANGWGGIITNMTSWGTGFGLQIGTNQKISALVSGSYLTTSWTPSVGVWYHISATHDSSTNLNILYVNGKEENRSTQAISYEANAKTFIGAFYTTPGLLFDGIIDHLKIYNYARTPAQIAYDYNKGGPVGWWKFDECQGNIAYDWSGIGNTGAITIGSGGSQNSLGTCQTGTSAAWTNGATGKINSSLNFDGTDDYIGISPYTAYSVNASLSAWVKGSYLNGTQIIIGSKDSISLGLINVGSTKAIIGYSSNGVNKEVGDASSCFVNDSWNHLTVIFNNSGNARYYCNGILLPSTGSNSWTWTDNTAYIGRRASGSYFNGQIDDVRLYNYALTSEQIKILYNGGAVSFN